MKSVFVTDFDGTLTRREFYQLVADRMPPAEHADFWAAFRAGRMSHAEAMARYCALAGTDEADVRRLASALEPDPRFGELVAKLNAAGWEVVVASAGCEWYIRVALEAFGVDVAVHSNRGRWVPGRGLVLEVPTGSPFFDPDVGVSKAAVVRDALERAGRVAFAGDGATDVPAALLVEAGLRFAKGDCAAELDRRGEGYRRFDRWGEVAEALLAQPLPSA